MTKPEKYERNRRVIDKPNKIDRIINPYDKIKNTIRNIRRQH